jgi:hypothetical protein
MLSKAYLGLDRVFPVIINSQDLLNISFTQLLWWLSGLSLVVFFTVCWNKTRTRPDPSPNVH